MSRKDPKLPSQASEGQQLVGKRVILTGATSDLGATFATALHEAGATLALVGRRQDRLDELAARLPRTTPIAADLANPQSLADVHRRAKTAIGPIDVLINAAGMSAAGVAAENEELADIEATLRVNLVAPFVLSQLVALGMRAAGSGVIVNVGSIAGEVGIGRIPQASYSASKGALHALTRELAAQWGRYGIRVNTLVPGLFRSDMTAGIFDSEKLVTWVDKQVLLPRHATEFDFVGALVFLASDASSYMTGQTLTIDGGWTAR